MADIITFDALYEALRREKVSQELQKLDDRFFGKVFSYLQEKNNLLRSQLEKAHLFPNEPIKTQKQIANTKKLIQDLFEKRESKIMTLAMYSARLNESSVPPNLLKEEAQFFRDIFNLCSFNRNATLNSLFALNNPLDMLVKPKEPSPEPLPIPETAPKEQPQSIKTPDQPAIPLKTVKFIHPTPAFVGNDLKVYGPFDKEDIASLPEKAADILIRKERAQLTE